MVGRLEEIYGTDIKFDGDLVATEGGDLDTISGLENYKSALLRRWTTSPNSYVHIPKYGAGLLEFMNAPATLDTKRLIAKRIEEQALRDNRTEKVLGVTFLTEDLTPEKTIIGVRIKPKGYAELEIKFNPFNEETY